MSRATTFKQADVTRMVRAVRAAGERPLEIVRSPDGEIRVIVGGARRSDPRKPNDFDPEFG
jgi:hypothetical protein